VPSQTTDTQGRFRYTGVARQTVTLTAKATGFNVVQKRVSIDTDPTKVEFTLHRSKGVTARVTTAEGLPVYGARIYLGQWQGNMMFDIGLSTDRQGRFHWDSAPDEEVRGSVYLPGYPSQPAVLRATPEEQVIVLTGPMIIRGTVVDGETGRPVQQVRTTYQMIRSGSRSGWQPASDKPTAGTFEVRVTTVNIDAIIVRVEAEGYLPTSSELIPMDGTAKQVDLKMFSLR
jgi:hypothetical protein